jgi:hypothetical protein
LWQRLQTLSVLDPTVGSGAFLFASLNILKPIYDACLDRMAVLRADGQLADYTAAVEAVLSDIKTHKSQTYTVLKRIMIHNLYGVDIMEEAVEICKLRLFLKLTAQITDLQHLEPLPDIDFNIRAGNTLVGYARLQDALQSNRFDLDGTQEELIQNLKSLAQTASRYRELQADHGATYADKNALNAELSKTAKVLDRRLADEYRIDVNDDVALKAWKDSHRPFHWCSEFYEIVEERGGFDVIVGNPPYVVYPSKSVPYQILMMKTVNTGNLFSLTTERCINLGSATKHIGVILPISSISTVSMCDLYELYQSNQLTTHISSFAGDSNPGQLFVGVKQQLAIHILNKGHFSLYTTVNYRWYIDERDNLFPNVSYLKNDINENVLDTTKSNTLPYKVGNNYQVTILKKIMSQSKSLVSYFVKNSGGMFYYRNASGSMFRLAFDHKPEIIVNNVAMSSSTLKEVEAGHNNYNLIGLMNSSLFNLFWVIVSDNYHINKRELTIFRMNSLDDKLLYEINWLVKQLMVSFINNSEMRIEQNNRNNTSRSVRIYYPKKSKHIIDEIDRVLAQHYGFTDEELDYIINYDIKYRMGLVDGAGDSDEEE